MVAPKLRFQEFDGDWESKKLKDLTDILKCGVASTPKYVTEGGYPFLSAQNISRNGEMNYSKVNNISDDFYKKISKTKLLKGDILYSRVGASYGVAAIFDREEEYGVYVSLTHIRVNDTLNNIFLKQFLNSPKARIQAEQGVFQGGGVQNLNVGVVEEFNLTLPSKQEQTKIASFLSAVDEKISQLTQKHQLLSQYKQGMMQKLFSQQIRFKADDGSESEEWASEKISKVFTNKSKSFNPLLNESLPCIELEHLSQNTGQILGTVNSSDQQSTKNLFEPNSVLYGKLRPYLRKFAKPQFKGVCSSEIWVLTGLKISNDYLFQFVQSEQFTELTNIQSGSKMPRADWNVIADAEIEFPCLREQTKIANFLSSIDQKIEVTAQQIEQAKQWKKGLLQQMFV
jgi:type I restriction enzyme, S subunit